MVDAKARGRASTVKDSPQGRQLKAYGEEVVVVRNF